MAEGGLEVERKYVAGDADAALPPLEGLDGVAEVQTLPTLSLEATYYDTPDLRLAASRVTLRRRHGGADDGWHLKLPAPGEGREEIRLPLTVAEDVPAEFAALVHGFTLGAPLEPVVRLQTERARTHLVGADGTALAELAADSVRASVRDGSDPTAWQEVEVELLDDADPTVLDAVEARLTEAGYRPATTPSKLAHALGDRVTPAPALRRAGPLTADSQAGFVALAYLREQVAQLARWDPEVRRDTPDAVHKMRVAARRLRSALATFRPLLDPGVTDPIRDELQWIGAELGHARDAEVMRDRLLAAVAAQPPELVMGPVVARITSELGGAYQKARQAAIEQFDGERYAALRRSLDDLCADPPWTELAAGRAGDVLPGLVRKTRKRVRRDAKAVEAAETTEARDTAMHEVRKAAKRARYAGESVEPVFGDDANAYAKAMEHLQEVLGDHQDGVVTRSALREMGVRASLAGENGFTYGLLAGLEESRADLAAQAYHAAVRAALRKHLAAWLTPG